MFDRGIGGHLAPAGSATVHCRDTMIFRITGIITVE